GVAAAPATAAPIANAPLAIAAGTAGAPQDWRDRDRNRDRYDRRDRRDDRQWRSDWRRYRNYDYNRLPPGERYYNPSDYYR
ncbi:hypothetical protein, partial [Klebsiella michiganensis]